MNLPTITMAAEVEAVMTMVDNDGIMSKTSFKEGDKVTGLVYRDGNGVEKTIEEGVIDAILINRANPPSPSSPILDGRPTAFIDNPAICPTSSAARYTVVPTAMIVDVAEKNRSKHVRIDFKNVVSVGGVAATVVTVTAETLPAGGVTEVISAVEDGGEVEFAAGLYAMESGLTVDKSVTIVGPNDVPQKARTKAEVVALAESETDIPGAVLSGACTINSAEAEVVFRGMSFTGDFRPVITAAKSVSFINCRFEDINASETKTMLFNMKSGAEAKVVIEGCYFGAPAAGSSGKMYHITEMTGKLVSGSSFSNNYLDKDCCTHNAFNIYDVVEGATINVNNNYIYKSAALSRVGIKGAATATVNYVGNEYDTTDVEEWAGLIGIQPYGKQTTDMSGWTINMNKTINNTEYEQLAVIYFAAGDMPYDETKFPKVYVDGKAYECAVINDQAPASTETSEETAAPTA